MANRKYPNAYQAKKAQRETDRRYKKAAYTSFLIRFHNVNERDIIDKLLEHKENKREYLRQLIRKDIAENNKNTAE